MRQFINQTVFVFFFALSLLLLYLLAPILTPFLLGALLAYLMNPLVKRLQKAGVSHLLSVIIIFTLLICLFLLLILMLFPLIEQQITSLIDSAPQIMNWTQEAIMPWLTEFVNVSTLKSTISTAIPKTGWVSTVVASSYTIIEWFVNLILTPIVTFYLLRDWDKILDSIKDLLPLSIRPTVIQIAKQCDEVLGAFFRGQLLVMLSLCFIYGIGLSLVGLKVGLIIGVIGGLLSIVPYLGSTFVLVTACITGLVQFGDWHELLWIIGVFLIGQALEGYVLTPNLVGNRIGLHPVAVIFAIMAGGSLFGFFGVLLALPMAAVIMVLLHFVSKRYHASNFYNHKKT